MASRKLFWTDERITGGEDPVELGSNNSGQGVGGSTVHYSMVAMRAHPEDFRRRTLEGEIAGADVCDWPLTFEELEPYYEEVEEALRAYVEGLFALWWESLRSLLAVKVFVDAPADVRLVRRIRRDVAERHRTTEQVLQQYVGTVRPMHERYVEPTRAHADVIVTNDGPIEDTVERLITVLRGRIADGSSRPRVDRAGTAAP